MVDQRSNPRDDIAPTLVVESPLRGSIATGDARVVTVRGVVKDDRHNVLRVTVNGQRARVSPDGHFTIDVYAGEGITLLRTEASDERGNKARDTRAVLGGTLVSVSTPVKDGVVAELDAPAVRAAGNQLAQRMGNDAFGAVVQRKSPILNENIACIGLRADATKAHHGAVKLTMTPMDGGLWIDADVPDLEIGLAVSWNNSCTTLKTEEAVARAAHFHLRGMVTFGVGDDGLVTVDREATDAGLDRFDIPADRIPTKIAERLRDSIEDTVTTIVADELSARLPSALLAGLGNDRSLAVGSSAIDLALRPSLLTFSSQLGVTVAVDSAIHLRGGLDSVYVSSSSTRPTLDTRRQISVGIADDSMNQLLSSMWSAGALEETVSSQDTDMAPLFDSLEVYPRLPPVVTALPGGDGLGVVMGDVECVFMKGGKQVARLSVSAAMNMAVSVQSQKMALTAAAPTLFVDVERDGPVTAAPFKPAQLTRVSAYVSQRLVVRLNEALSRFPLPASPSSMIVSSYLGASSDSGYVIVAGDFVSL